MTTSSISKKTLDELYDRYNRREFVHPDPVEVLYEYEDAQDREIAALLASSLAYGRVAQILKSVRLVLGRMGSPWPFLMSASEESLWLAFGDFKHRFSTGEELCAMLWGARRVIERYGSLEGCFAAHLRPGHDTVIPALTAFVKELGDGPGSRRNSLLPSPRRGSACKRLHLFLRWMVRRDAVDPGGWDSVPACKLVVPFDVHMGRMCRALGLTRRKQTDMRTALEVTTAFRRIAPDDPVRYDFALTRFGIRNEPGMEAFLRRCRQDGAINERSALQQSRGQRTSVN